MDWEKLIERFDKCDMRGSIERIPEQFSFALDDPEFPKLESVSPKKIIFTGMGGSALPYDILLSVYGDQISIPVRIERHYFLPNCDKETLVVAASFSGNTEETLASYQSARKAGAKIIAIAGGGKLMEFARGDGTTFVKIPKEREAKNFQPRMATGYFFTYLTRILSGLAIIRVSDEIPKLIEKLKGYDPRDEAKRLALELKDKVPIFYSPPMYRNSLARILKIKINENSKAPAFYNDLPEANHNETIGFTTPNGRYHIVYLHNPECNPNIRLRAEVMKRLFSERKMDNIGFYFYTMKGETRLERIFLTLYFGEWVSFYLAMLYGYDPTPVEMVEQFKKAIEEARG
ncbi:MAG: bifunctional phosphoglucose/phosphomannose isomerase [Myxococcota bacterium]